MVRLRNCTFRISTLSVRKTAIRGHVADGFHYRSQRSDPRMVLQPDVYRNLDSTRHLMKKCFSRDTYWMPKERKCPNLSVTLLIQSNRLRSLEQTYRASTRCGLLLNGNRKTMMNKRSETRSTDCFRFTGTPKKVLQNLCRKRHRRT